MTGIRCRSPGFEQATVRAGSRKPGRIVTGSHGKGLVMEAIGESIRAGWVLGLNEAGGEGCKPSS